ncbi:MAG: hypothetical protein HQL46_01590 [Gammaproteobacteria bacterium]|nr:hypothetical protein [Gammaproteobacteria bacterium]
MELLVFSFSLGGLLFALIATNDIAEHIEYKKRLKKLSVLRLKRQIDEFDDYIERLALYFLPKDINLYCLNEMRARLDEVANLEPDYLQLEELVDDVQHRIDDIAPMQALNKPKEGSEDPTEEEQESEKPEVKAEEQKSGEESTDANLPELKLKPIPSEKDLEHLVILLRSFTIYIREEQARSDYNSNHQAVIDQLIEFKYEYISRFYTEQSRNNINLKKYARALTYAKKLHTLLVMSGFNSDRIKEMSKDVVDLQAEINQLRGNAEKEAEAEAERKLKEKREQDKANPY